MQGIVRDRLRPIRGVDEAASWVKRQTQLTIGLLCEEIEFRPDHARRWRVGGGLVGAQAVTLYGTFSGALSFAGGAFSETFTLQSDGGVVDPLNGAHFTDFTLSGDSLGNTIAFVGDNTTGIKTTGTDGIFATGTDSTATEIDSFDPALYSSFPGPGVLKAGVYNSDTLIGSTLTLTTNAVPEPEAWALLIAGAGMVGGALRTSRRRAALAA